MVRTCLWLLALAAATWAAPSTVRRDHATKEEHPPPAGWERVIRAPASHVLNLRIALKQHRFEELESLLHQISDPDHPTYGRWLSSEQSAQYAKPHQEASAAVYAWLNEHNITAWSQSVAGDWLHLSLPISTVERMLDTEYHVFRNDEGHELVRTTAYSLPVHLHNHIDMIAPTTYFGNMEAQKKAMMIAKTDVDPDCSYTPQGYKWGRHGRNGGPLPSSPPVNLTGVCVVDAVTSLCLRTLYRTIDYVPQVPQRNFVGMTAYLNESANISDFRVFLSRQRQDANLNYTYDVASINGGINYQNRQPPALFRIRDLEANLDSQTIGGFVYPTRFQVQSTGGSPPFTADESTPDNTNEPYLDWVASLLAQPREALPNTISTSYSDSEQTVPYSYAQRVCQEFAQLTSRGVTLLFSAGDNGVGPNGTCVSNDGSDTRKFLPSFPPSCPYVTSVGGTRNFGPEIVAYDTRNGYISGSGVSNYFARPRWQDRVVSSYKNQIGDLHSGLWNTSGRAYPDISAQGYRYVVVYGGSNIFLDGTSCSAPAVNGILTLVNDALIAAGRPVLGYLNPWLYKYGWRGFTDIINGTTWGCETSGFPAKNGWDFASGWGTPDFLKLKQIALNGPPTAVFNKD